MAATPETASATALSTTFQVWTSLAPREEAVAVVEQGNHYQPETYLTESPTLTSGSPLKVWDIARLRRAKVVEVAAVQPAVREIPFWEAVLEAY